MIQPSIYEEWPEKFNEIEAERVRPFKEIIKEVKADDAIREGHADLISFGRPFITNPDYPQRILNNWDLGPFDDPTYWYEGGSQGYTDYPSYR